MNDSFEDFLKDHEAKDKPKPAPSERPEEKPATGKSAWLKNPKLILLIAVFVIVVGTSLGKSRPAESTIPVMNPSDVPLGKRYTLDDIYGTQPGQSPETPIEKPVMPVTDQFLNPTSNPVQGEVQPTITEPPPMSAPFQPMPDFGTVPPPAPSLSVEAAKRLEAELSQTGVTVLGGKLKTARAIQGFEPEKVTTLKARVAQKVIAVENTLVMATIDEAAGDNLPIGTQLQGHVLGEAEDRIFIEFYGAIRPDGTRLKLNAVALDGRDRGEGLKGRRPKDWKTIASWGLNLGLPMIPFVGPRLAGGVAGLQPNTNTYGYGYKQQRPVVFGGGRIYVFLLSDKVQPPPATANQNNNQVFAGQFPQANPYAVGQNQFFPRQPDAWGQTLPQQTPQQPTFPTTQPFPQQPAGQTNPYFPTQYPQRQ